MIERTQHNGCSEAEALQAASKVGEMMNKYDVSMNEVQFADEEFNTLYIKLNSKRVNFMSHVLFAIGKFTDTKIWMSYYTNEDTFVSYRRYCFFGTNKDIMIADYIYSVIESAIKTELAKYKKSIEFKKNPSGGRTKSANFMTGITNRLSIRLQDMKEEMEVENKKAASMNENPTVGVEEVESSLIVYDKFDIVEKKFKDKLGLKLKTTYSSRSIRDNSAFQRGIDAGDNVNIRKAVGSAKSGGQKLIG